MIEFTAGAALPLTARALWAGDDLCVVVTGGEAHIGSVSVAVPRESLRRDGTHSATVSTINMTGHKDDFIGNRVAHHLASALSCRVVATCGVHVDDAGPAVIDAILEDVEALADGLLRLLTARNCRGQ